MLPCRHVTGGHVTPVLQLEVQPHPQQSDSANVFSDSQDICAKKAKKAHSRVDIHVRIR